MVAENAHSRRAAAVLLLAGVGLVLIGLAMLLQQEYVELRPDHLETGVDEAPHGVHPPATAPGPQPGTATLDTRRQSRMLRQVLFLTLILVLVFAVSSLAFLRWSRRYRRSLLQKPRRPTPDSDVWAMHRLPPEDVGPASGRTTEDDQPPGRGV